MKVSLHIGFTKTGTSQFQFSMSNSEKELAKQKIFYPESGRKFNAHHGLVNLLIQQRVNTAGEPTTDFNTLIKEIKEKEAKGFERTVISSEALMLAKAPLEGLHKLISEFDVKVYAFVRPPISWVNSMLNQTYKNILYDRPHVDESIDQHGRAKRFIDAGMKFHRRLEVWEDIVGKANMVVACLNPGDDFMSTILDTMSIELHDNIQRDFKSSNASFSAESLQYLAWLAKNKNVYNHDEKVRFMNILGDYSKISGTKVSNYIPPALWDLAIEKAKLSREKISKHYFGGAEVLSEKLPFSTHFDFENYDPKIVLQVNSYVLMRLDRRIQEVRAMNSSPVNKVISKIRNPKE
ncbi:MAG: hypothetical protein ACI9FB_001388 [Candidatus Azotimanducaceae bacterium]|jgi:hypothetical protein